MQKVVKGLQGRGLCGGAGVEDGGGHGGGACTG